MKKIVDRLQQIKHDVVFTPSIRWYRMPRPDIRYPRYPAPASEPVDIPTNKHDYKLAFRDSAHSIRHDKHVEVPEDYHFSRDPYNETLEEKLVRTGFLKKSEVLNSSSVDEAIKNYEEETGYKVEQKVYQDDLGLDEKQITADNRESIAYAVRQIFNLNKEVNQNEDYLNDLDDIYNPTFYFYNTYDMAASDPVLRQVKMDLEWIMEKVAERNEAKGEMPVFKGDPSFWHALDNSFSPQNIKMVQESIGDKASNLDPNALQLNHNVQNPRQYDSRPFPIQSDLR